MAVQIGGRRRGFRDINVTPLVDVMLVLLVVFMVTAPLLTTGLRIDLPEVKAAQTPVKDARLLVADPGAPTSAVPLVRGSNRPPPQPGLSSQGG